MKGYIFLSLSIIFWALNFHLGKIMFESVTPNVAAFWRFFFAVLGLLVLSWRVIPSKATIINRLPGMLLVGFIGVFGFIFCFTQGLNATSEMNGALFVGLSPAISLILAGIFLGHKIQGKEVLGILMAFLGLTYLLTQGDISVLSDLSFSKGDIYFALAATFFAVQNILIKQFIGETNGVFFTFATNLCCLVGFTGLLFAEPTFHLNHPPEFWIAAIGMGLPGTALAYYGWNLGVKQIGPARAPVFLNMIPAMVAIFAVPFGAELYGFHLISLLIIVAGVLVIQVKKRK